MNAPGTVFVPRDALHKITTSNHNAGALGLRHVPSDDIFVVHVVETAPNVRQQVDIPKAQATLRAGDAAYEGQWIRGNGSEISVVHANLLHRPGAEIPLDSFRQMVAAPIDPGGKALVVITHTRELSNELEEAGFSEYTGWIATRSGVTPTEIAVEPRVLGLGQLEGQWPVEQLAHMTVAVVGCGSIGGAAATALAGYGVGNLVLADHDRFLWHNMIRHELGAESVGRNKAAALADAIREDWNNIRVEAFPMDVVSQADRFRSLVGQVDLVLCAADGIAPRRVVSHSARRAKKPAVLACVLDSGAIGEVMRLRPTPRYGCLLCVRAAVTERGSMDAEADQELAYGTGSAHLPMSAVPSDLRWIGSMAAKVATATLLESRLGDRSQELPGEQALVGLRPGGDLLEPYDLRHALEVRWGSVPPPREGCPTCNP